MTMGEMHDQQQDQAVRRRRVRQRWLWGALAGLLVLCVAAPAGAVVVWLGRGAVEAGKGEATPAGAVNVFMLAVSSGEELGLRAALAEDRRDELVDRWRELRGEIARTDPPPAKVAMESLDVEDQVDDIARVVAGVRGIWWSAKGSGMSTNGSVHPWRFEVRRDGGGWRVWSVNAYPWCGGHVRADACR